MCFRLGLCLIPTSPAGYYYYCCCYYYYYYYYFKYAHQHKTAVVKAMQNVK